MDLNKLLQMDDELPELNDQDFPDQEQRLYRSFLNKIKTEKISLPLIYSDAFKNIKFLKKNPHLLEAIKKYLQEQFDKNPNKSKGKIEQVQISGEQFLNNIPAMFFIPQSSRVNLITRLTQKKNSIRELIYDLLPLYEDDVIEMKIKFHGKEYIKVSGEIKTLVIPTDDFLKIPLLGKDLEMMTVELKMLGSGDFRRRHEESSNIFDTQKEKDNFMSQEHQVELFVNSIKRGKLTPAQIVERAKLFNLSVTEDPASWEVITTLTPVDFNTKKITDMRDINLSFSHLGTNEQLMKFKLRLDLELNKMDQWLNRANPDGKDGFFK